ncbi:hypothetical protein QLQ12_27910 [Actinoplanes sp. NEAU-A12]|uniref:Uncharacterized protein n=1 Tax=Actinoplanes sandaracinus TaxID=3045177 RepID=A0ABT6WRT2_9ACTN|nr:hypothetical protein [Actinoplanes sandaracinus]MDI6102451.1 hypothetical protein [Actinoplanes sandaracinus]
MDLDAVIGSLDWAWESSPPQQDPARVKAALHSIASGQSEVAVAWAVAALQDAAGNSHAAVLFPVAAPAAAVMLAVAGRWRAEARAQALVSLAEMLETEVLPGYDSYERDGVMVDVEQVIKGHVRNALPLLRSIAAGPQPWQHNRRLARSLIELSTDDA